MAKTNAQRRARRVRLVLAVLVLWAGAVFVRDVLRAAHASRSTHASVNRAFAGLTDALLMESNRLDRDTVSLWRTAPSRPRTTFLAGYANLAVTAQTIATQTQRLASPPIVGHVNRAVMDLTMRRLAAWRTLRAAAQGPLLVEGQTTPSPEATSAAFDTLASLNDSWRVLRRRLEREPGHVLLADSRWQLADARTRLSLLERAPSLRPSGGASLDAVLVSPQPLPAVGAQLVLLAQNSVTIAISVRNHASVGAALRVDLTVQPTNGKGRYVAMSRQGTLHSLGTTGFTFRGVSVAPSEQGVLRITVRGAMPSFPGALARSYTLLVAPSS